MIGRIALTLLLALVLAPRVAPANRAAPACVEDEAVRAPNLHEWERELLRDCAPGGSRLGDVRPFGVVPAGASAGASATARAHVLLGLKALHNFFYENNCSFEARSDFRRTSSLAKLQLRSKI